MGSGGGGGGHGESTGDLFPRPQNVEFEGLQKATFRNLYEICQKIVEFVKKSISIKCKITTTVFRTFVNLAHTLSEVTLVINTLQNGL